MLFFQIVQLTLAAVFLSQALTKETYVLILSLYPSLSHPLGVGVGGVGGVENSSTPSRASSEIIVSLFSPPVNNGFTPSSSIPQTIESRVTEEIQPFVKRKLFLPEGRCSHRIVQVTGSEISAISVRQMKVDTSKIIDDHKKRMLPRFR